MAFEELACGSSLLRGIQYSNCCAIDAQLWTKAFFQALLWDGVGCFV
jgi:hypothetical protein